MTSIPFGLETQILLPTAIALSMPLSPVVKTEMFVT